MKDIVRKINVSGSKKLSLTREWLTANGIGGYASGTLSLTPTRRYHGLLIAALPYPMGRVVMLSHLEETLVIKNKRYHINTLLTDSDHSADQIPDFIKEFRLENGLPCWRIQIGSVILEKKLHLVYLQNTVHIKYTLLSGISEAGLELEAFVDFRFHKDAVSINKNPSYYVSVGNKEYEIHKKTALLFLP